MLDAIGVANIPGAMLFTRRIRAPPAGSATQLPLGARRYCGAAASGTMPAFEGERHMFGGSDIFVVIVVFLAILTVFLGVKTVPQGYNWTVERFGRYTRMLSPGLNLIVPFIDRIGRKMNVMEQVIDVPEQEVITKDNATVSVDGIAFYQVFDAAKASYEVASLEQAIVKLTMTNIRSVMGAMDLDQMLSHRDEINERLLRVVDAAVSPWGIKVNRIEIKDIVPPADLIQSMGRQMKAERDKRAEILTAEGQRQSAILKAEGAKQAQILEAEGRREAAFRDAEARERSAAAEAKATEVVSAAIASGNVASLNYFIADKYLRALTEIAHSPNQKILMLPIEATAALGSLAGIAEIAKETFGGGGGGGAAPLPPRTSTPAIGPKPAS
jgi:regulator of protease activity HflC (stomatin/prohibitin superfamily)